MLPMVPSPVMDPLIVFTAAADTMNAHNQWHDTLHRKANQMLDVKDFGATGDGVTDDTEAIQEALDAANGVVTFPPGAYLVTTVTIPTRTALFGYGATLISDANGPTVSLAGTRDVSWNGLNVIYRNPTFTGAVVDASGASTLVIRDTKVTSNSFESNRSADTLINLTDTHTVSLESVFLSGAQSCVKGGGYGNAIGFRHVTFANADVACVLNPKSAWNFVNCVFEACDQEPRAIRSVEAGAMGLSLVGCWFGDDLATGDWVVWNGDAISAVGCNVSLDQVGSNFVKTGGSVSGVFLSGLTTRGEGALFDDSGGASTGVAILGNHLIGVPGGWGVEATRGGVVSPDAVVQEKGR